MLRSKLYQNPFFSTVYQSINSDIAVLLRLFVNSHFTFPYDQYQGFFFPLSIHKHGIIRFVKINVATLQRNKLALYQTQNGGPKLFSSELSIKQELSNIIELTSCLVHVLCGFSTGCLNTSREFSLLFKNTMKTFCCFIVSFK